MRLPVDRRAPDAHPRHQFRGAGRPLPARSQALGVAQALGSGAAGGVSGVVPKVRCYCPALGDAKNGASLATSAGPKWACGFDGGAWSISSQPWIRTRALSNACSQIDARPYALPEKRITEIGPVALGRAAERCAVGVRGGEHDRVVVGEHRHEAAGEARRHDDDTVLDAFAVERSRDLLRRQLAGERARRAQRESAPRPVRGHQQEKDVGVPVHHRGERMHRLGKIALVGERQALARVPVVH